MVKETGTYKPLNEKKAGRIKRWFNTRNAKKAMDAIEQRQTALMKLTEYLIQNKFYLIDAKKVNELYSNAEELAKKGEDKPKEKIIEEGEMVFNRGEGAKSNFFVYVKEEKDKIIVYYTNPDPRKKAATLPRNKIYIKRVFKKGNPEKFVKAVGKGILIRSSLKKENAYRKVSHGHWDQEVFYDKDGIRDDGSGEVRDIIRKMMFWNIDIDATTPHNSFQKNKINAVERIEKELGIVKVPALELTMSMKELEPNGPHMLIWMADYEVGEEIKKAILDKREDLKMISLFMGMQMGEMFEILKPYIDEGKITLGVPHAVNQHDPSLKIHAVGLMTAVEKGAMEIEDAEGIIGDYCSSVGCWNATLKDDELKVDGKLKEYLDGMRKRQKLGKKLTANVGNFALSREFKLLKHTFFDPDDHRVRPMDYDCSGDLWGHGATIIYIGKKKMDMLRNEERKPTSAELVGWLQNEEVVMQGIIYGVMENGVLKIARARRRPTEVENEQKKRLEEKNYSAYVKVLAQDAWYFIRNARFGDLWRMKG
ncbi:hypothetical protein KAW38_03895 [Candidatus Micrarchaeota archaeon]|nr:hypothetical protein [Candidatus Micrarchaeota archaeon]